MEKELENTNTNRTLMFVLAVIGGLVMSVITMFLVERSGGFMTLVEGFLVFLVATSVLNGVVIFNNLTNLEDKINRLLTEKEK